MIDISTIENETNIILSFSYFFLNLFEIFLCKTVISFKYTKKFF